MQNSPGDKLHSIENNRTKDIPPNRTIAINTDSISFNRDVATNTPNYAEQMARELDKGNTPQEIMQMFMQSKTRKKNK